jgi:hypothetical protein
MWVTVRKNDDSSPCLFKGFTTAYDYMYAEFAVTGCDGMSLIDHRTDTTKWCVVYVTKKKFGNKRDQSWSRGRKVGKNHRIR